VSDDLKPEDVFTAAHRLLLLQLTTRRAMYDRHASTRTAAVPDSENYDTAPEPQLALAKDTRWKLVPNGVVLHDWQREALRIWVELGRGTVKVATGGGKTLFALAAAEALQNEREPDLRLVVIVPTIPLMFQWRDEVSRGNLPASSIGLMGGGRELPPVSTVRVLICVLNSARERLPELVRRADWSRRMLLVVDECHRAAASQARRIFEVKPRYTLGLSATPESDLDAGEVPTDEAYAKGPTGQALGPIIYDFTLQQSLEAGLLTPFEVWHIGLPLSPPEAAEHGQLSREIGDLRKRLQTLHRRARSKQGFLAWCQSQGKRGGAIAAEAQRFIALANKRKRLLYRASARTDVSLFILSELLAEQDGRAIVFHESIDEIEQLFLKALERNLPAVLEHSQLPDSVRADNIEAFREGVGRIIISAKSLVEGFNVPSADLGIIAASSSSVRQRIQSLGRMLRRKPGNRHARVIVLYVADTEDEAIYEKADWDNVIGAERNRYFRWPAPGEAPNAAGGLQETTSPPRAYRPPSWEVDVSALSAGDSYPGQPHGQDVRVDPDDNLRAEDGEMLQASRAVIAAIAQYNVTRRARITPAGHLIVRVDAAGGGASGGADWRYLGTVNAEEGGAEVGAIKLKLQMVSGRRVIARDDDRKRVAVSFALGPEAASDREAGEAVGRLLEWVRQEETRMGRTVKSLWWDGQTSYWLEAESERVRYPAPLPPLQFRV
jgi:superfamily II DNA or RNA helicase